MKRLLLAPLVVTAALALAPTAQGAGAYHAECTTFFPGSTGGEITVTPGGAIEANCRYPGPAEGGGVVPAGGTNNCVIAPAGNFQCHPNRP